MKLTAENTAIVLDSTADFPEAPRALPELARRAALRALRRRELQRLRRARPGAVLRAAARRPPSCRRRRSRRPATSSPSTRSSRRVRAHPLAADLVDALGHVRERADGGRELGGDAVRVIDTRTVSAALAMLALGVQRRLERGTTDEEIDELVERYRREHELLFTRRHARVPREGRAHRPGGRVRRQPAEREADPHDPRRRGRAAEARAREPEGVRRVPRAVRGDVDRLAALKVGIAHAAAPERLEALRELVERDAAAGADRDRDDARRRRRHARRARHGRLLLVRRRRVGSVRSGSYARSRWRR